MKRHARHTGEIIWAWNILFDQLYELLAALITDQSPVHAKLVAAGMWGSIQSDNAKLALIQEIADLVYATRALELDAVTWLLRSVGDLLKHRNDAAHIPVKFGLGGIGKVHLVPQIGSGRSTGVERLLERPTAKIWRSLRGDLMALAGYAMLLAQNLRGDAAAPWPRKPRLLVAPRKSGRRTRTGRR